MGMAIEINGLRAVKYSARLSVDFKLLKLISDRCPSLAIA